MIKDTEQEEEKMEEEGGGSDDSSVGGEFWATSSDKGLTFTELGRKADYKDKL